MSKPLDVVRATLAGRRCAYRQNGPDAIVFANVSETAAYALRIMAAEKGFMSCACLPMDGAPIRNLALVNGLVEAANREHESREPGLVFFVAPAVGTLACYAIFETAEPTVAMLESVIEATLDLTDDVQEALATPEWIASAIVARAN